MALCTKIAKLAASRPIGSVCEDPEGAKLEAELSEAVDSLGIGAQGLGGNSTAFAVHVETAATHITMNPAVVNIICNSAPRARATFTLRFHQVWVLGDSRMANYEIEMPCSESEVRQLKAGDTVIR